MPLGYCEECKSLRSIRVLSQKWGSRECDWTPIDHEATTHVACGGNVEHVLEDDGRWRTVCENCGALPDETLLLTDHCPGSGRPIR